MADPNEYDSLGIRYHARNRSLLNPYGVLSPHDQTSSPPSTDRYSGLRYIMEDGEDLEDSEAAFEKFEKAIRDSLFSVPAKDYEIRLAVRPASELNAPFPGDDESFQAVRHFLYKILTISEWGIALQSPHAIRATVENWWGAGYFFRTQYEKRGLDYICPATWVNPSSLQHNSQTIEPQVREMIASCTYHETSKRIACAERKPELEFIASNSLHYRDRHNQSVDVIMEMCQPIGCQHEGNAYTGMPSSSPAASRSSHRSGSPSSCYSSTYDDPSMQVAQTHEHSTLSQPQARHDSTHTFQEMDGYTSPQPPKPWVSADAATVAHPQASSSTGPQPPESAETLVKATPPRSPLKRTFRSVQDLVSFPRLSASSSSRLSLHDESLEIEGLKTVRFEQALEATAPREGTAKLIYSRVETPTIITHLDPRSGIPKLPASRALATLRARSTSRSPLRHTASSIFSTQPQSDRADDPNISDPLDIRLVALATPKESHQMLLNAISVAQYVTQSKRKTWNGSASGKNWTDYDAVTEYPNKRPRPHSMQSSCTQVEGLNDINEQLSSLALQHDPATETDGVSVYDEYNANIRNHDFALSPSQQPTSDPTSQVNLPNIQTNMAQSSSHLVPSTPSTNVQVKVREIEDPDAITPVTETFFKHGPVEFTNATVDDMVKKLKEKQQGVAAPVLNFNEKKGFRKKFQKGLVKAFMPANFR